MAATATEMRCDLGVENHVRVNGLIPYLPHPLIRCNRPFQKAAALYRERQHAYVGLISYKMTIQVAYQSKLVKPHIDVSAIYGYRLCLIPLVITPDPRIFHYANC